MDADVLTNEISILDALATTRSIRRYHLGEDVPEEIINRMLFYATRAPNPGNQQTWRFIVLRRDAAEARAMLGDAYRDGWAEMRVRYGYDRLKPGEDSPKSRVARAMEEFVGRFEDVPLLVVACVSRITPASYLGGAPAIFPACQNLLLAARALGYGGVLTTWHRRIEGELRAHLHVPDDALMAATISLGRPRGGFGPVRRKPLREAVYVGRWGETADWVVDPEPDR